MSLSEEEIVRYSRQILLREVGGEGQEKLLATGVKVLGRGTAVSVAMAYLAASGVQVESPERSLSAPERGFLGAEGRSLRTGLASFASSGRAPTGRGQLSALPERCAGLGPWVAIGETHGEAAIAFRAEEGCEACFRATVACWRPPSAGISAGLVAGAVAALAMQRLLLGISPLLGAVRLSADGAVGPLEMDRCEHRH
jgi:hypothetical protein